MKPRKQMAPRASEQVPGTFSNVTACFTEEEWRLLHHWQKQLYKNVMQEIHRAMSELGPAIAASVFSLRPQELSSADLLDLELQSSIEPASSEKTAETEVHIRKKQYRKDTRDTDQRKGSRSPRTGHSNVDPVVSLNIKQEGQLYPAEQSDYGGRDSFGSLTSHTSAESEQCLEGVEDSDEQRRSCGDRNTGNLLKLEEESMSDAIDRCSAKRGGRSESSAKEIVDEEAVISYNIKQEEQSYPVENIETEEREGVATRFPYHYEETDAGYRDYHYTGREASGVCRDSGPEVTSPGASVGMNPEVDTYVIDVEEYQRSVSPKSCGGPEVTSPGASVGMNPEVDTYVIDVDEYQRSVSPKSCGGAGSMKRKRNFDNSFSKLFKSLPTQPDVSMPLAVHERRCSGSDWEVSEEHLAPWESGFTQSPHSNLCHIPPDEQLSGAYTKCESTASTDNDSPRQSNSLQSYNPTSSPEGEQSTDPNWNRRTHKVKGTCTWWPPAMYIYHDLCDSVHHVHPIPRP